MNGRETPPEIVDAFLKGEADAVRLVETAVGRALSGRSLNLGDARDDVRQEALRRLIVSFRAGQFRGEAALSTYVYKVAHGAAIDYWRSVRRRREESSEGRTDVQRRFTLPTQMSAVERLENRRLVGRLLGRLGAPCRELLFRIYFDESTYAVIGQALGKSEDAIKVQAHRCRREAARLLSRLKETDALVTLSGAATPNPSSPFEPPA